MRLTILVTAAAIAMPAALTAASAPGMTTQAVTDVSAAKAKKKPAKKKEENLKAAPGTGPSGPATKY